MTKNRNRLQEDPRRSESPAAARDNPAGRRGEGTANARLGDRGASTRDLGTTRRGQGTHGGNRKPAPKR